MKKTIKFTAVAAFLLITILSLSPTKSHAFRFKKAKAPTKIETTIPSIIFSLPVSDNIISHSPVVIFKGKVLNSKELLLNKKTIQINKDGSFEAKQFLINGNEDHIFKFIAKSKDGKIKAKIKKIYYKVGKLPLKAVNNKTKAQPIEKKATKETALNEQNVFFSLPKNNQCSYKPRVLFKGHVVGVKKLLINNKNIPVSKKGLFYSKENLRPGIYNDFIIEAILNNGVKREYKKRVFYKEQKPPIPNITLEYPNKNHVSTKRFVTFKGVATNALQLTVNDKVVNRNEKGEFFLYQELTRPGGYNEFIFQATSKSGAHYHLSRNILYQQKNNEVTKVRQKKPLIVNKVSTITKQTKKVPAAKRKATKKAAKPITKSIKQATAKPKQIKEDPVAKQKAKKKVVIPIKKLSNPKVKVKTVLNRIPKISINSPENNFVTYKNSIFIKGKVTNAKEFFINNRVITLNSDGNFRESFKLPKVGKHVFNLYALGEDKLNTSKILKIFKATKVKKVKKKTKLTIDERLSKKISLDLDAADIKDVLKILAKKSGLNIVADESLSGIVSINLKDETIRNVIEYVLKTQGISYRISENTIVVASASNLNIPVQMKSSIVKLHNASVIQTTDILKEYLSSGESISMDEKNNYLIINAGPKKIIELMNLIKQLDKQKVPQIILIAQILEVSSQALRRAGITWPSSASLALKEGTPLNVPASQLEYAMSISGIMLQNLQEEGDAKILAKPQVKVIDGESAEIFIGDKIPYIEIQTDASGRLTESVKYAQTGINLKIEPKINPERREIQLKINPEVSYVNGYRGKNNDIPILRTRRVNTTVWVNDGETAVIGGLFNSSDSKASNKVPILGDLPLLGGLFTGKRDEDIQTELVITVTPRIVSGITATPTKNATLVN